MLRVNHLVGFGSRQASGGGGGGSGEYGYIGLVSNAASSTTYTFSSAGLGAADAAREIVLCVGWVNGAGVARSISTVTVGGISASIVAQHTTASGAGSGIVQAAVPTGTTGDIVVTFDAGASGCIVGIYRIIPLSATPVDFGATGGNSPRSVTDVQVSSGGFLILGGMAGNALTATYNGVDTPVSDAAAIFDGRGYIFWSCAITESITTNDPGATTGGSHNTNVAAVSYL